MSQSQRAERWWGDVSALADDGMEGRLAGSPGYDRAADYVVGRLKRIGLRPAGNQGWFQPVAFEEQFVLAAQSRAMLVGANGETALSIPGDLIISRRDAARPQLVDAPLVFVGYGLHIPEAGHDDFAGLDLKGKIAVYVSGGPEALSGAIKSDARAQRARLLQARGAIGMLALTTPNAVEIPWSRSIGTASQSGMYLADTRLRQIGDGFFAGELNPERSAILFTGSGHDFADIAKLADASAPVPRFVLGQSLRAEIATRRAPISSKNIVALLPGHDRRLKSEYVILSAHLDHLGVGEPIAGDRIFNGALDNAGGVATLLDIAQNLKARGARPKRSILFVFLTAEEKGSLGSRYFARRPTVPRDAIVADLNFDMPLPIFPLKSVIALGAEESSLGALAKASGDSLGLPLVPDPLPERNTFIRSDQYSFVRQGIPSLAFKFGFAKDSPEAQTEKAWRAARYHGPSDDLSQPVDKAGAIRLNDFVADLALRTANTAERPAWLANSFFSRFASPPAAAAAE
jgi:Zn-dependent M28 family amino/carboxypeptidase